MSADTTRSEGQIVEGPAVRCIVVSMTSTRSRLSLLYYAVESIRRQSLIPCRVEVFLSREPYLYDAGVTDPPDWLLDGRVQLHWVENTGSYRKLIPGLLSLDYQDLLVTADDDVIYGPHWLQTIVASALDHPESIVCGRARRVRRDMFNRDTAYLYWPEVTRATRGRDMVPVGCAGVAYRQGLLDLSMASDRRALSIAATSDDLWFRACSLVKGVDVFVNPDIDSENVYMLHQHGLTSRNVGRGSRRGFLSEASGATQRRVRSLLGLPIGENDAAWSRIKRYVTLHHRGEHRE
jgi:hypothetical protein